MGGKTHNIPQQILARIPDVSVEPLYRRWQQAAEGYKQLCAVAAAVRLGLFDHLDETRRPEELASLLGTDSNLTADLCDLLVEMGLLAQEGAGLANTSLSRTYLHGGSPWFQGAVIDNIFSGFGLWQRMEQICREGPIRVDEADFFENNLVDSLAAEILTGELQQTIAAVAHQPGFPAVRRALDLGGGHGLYAMALANQNPNIEAVVFDFPTVAKDFCRYRQRFGAENVRFVPGNLFADDLGRDFDLVLFSYNPGGKNEVILEKIHSCLNRGGLFVTKHAFYRQEERSKSALLDAEWQLIAFSGVEKGRNVYAFGGDLSWEAYTERLQQGFVVDEIIDTKEFATPPLAKFGDRLDSKIIICRKR
jgi:predicted O-methyltransferase YrrM